MCLCSSLMSLNRAAQQLHGCHTARALPWHQAWSASRMSSCHAFCFPIHFWNPQVLIPGNISWPQLSTCPLRADNWPYSYSIGCHHVYSPCWGYFLGGTANRKVHTYFLTMLVINSKLNGLYWVKGQVYVALTKKNFKLLPVVASVILGKSFELILIYEKKIILTKIRNLTYKVIVRNQGNYCVIIKKIFYRTLNWWS